MNSEERRAARRKRREEKRARNRAERIKDCTLDDVADIDALYRAAKQAQSGVNWKASVQRYDKDVLRNVAKMRVSLLSGEDICKGFIRFRICERGKNRDISAVHFSERVPQKSITQNALVPAMEPTFIKANTANRRGMGTGEAIRIIKSQLDEHFRKHGSEGYILQIDFANYFASIPHEPVKEMISKAFDDPRLIGLLHHMIDVQGDVGLGLGSEPNQILAIALPNRIDHFVLEMCSVEAYGRYMDDSYLIHTDKEYLQSVLILIRDLCAKMQIPINDKKTRITKLSRGFVFLKKRFFYSPTGKVVVKPCRETITRKRRRLKKQVDLYRRGIMTYEQLEQSYQSARGDLVNLDAHRTLLSFDALFKSLMEGDPKIARGGGSPS